VFAAEIETPLDNFKMINDEYGHPEGDLALAVFGKILIKCFREHDLFARVGGDEFVALLEDGEDITLAAKGRLEDAVKAWKNGKHSHRRGKDLLTAAEFFGD
jgi:diguanylate cyclase (GGDEF)-like protein